MRKLLAIAALCWSTQAFGGVIYNWVNVGINPAFGAITGSIEFRDEVWRSGGLESSIYSYDTQLLYDRSPILSFDFSDANGTAGYQSFHWHPVICSDDFRCARDGILDPDAVILTGNSGNALGQFDLDFGALISGSIHIDNTSTSIRLSGGPLWEITSYSTDGYGPGGTLCSGDNQTGLCAGSSGVWVLNLATIPKQVPEPSSLALLLGGLFFLRRRIYG